MASYVFSFGKYYTLSNGFLNTSQTGVSVVSPDIDDGKWDVGDAFVAGGSFLFIGSYTVNGHLFLVFENSDFSIVASPTAVISDPGFPGNYNIDLPPLDTNPLPTCFLAGTRIATPGGEVAVEDLATGDTVLTADGRAVPVRWIGRQTILKRFYGPAAQPVRIRAGAFAPGVPHSDLNVTAEHGMILDELVVNAGALVDGVSVVWVPLTEVPDRYTVYHIETELHDVILANGAAAETFVDYAGRQRFDNYAEFVALCGTEPVIAESPLPRISAARHLPAALRERLSGSAGLRRA